MDSTTESAPPVWYYAAVKQGTNEESPSDFDVRGPLDEATIADLIRGGILSEKTWVMRQGYDAWTSLESSELSKHLSEKRRTANDGDGIINLVKRLVCKWTGLPALEGFHLSCLFVGAFQRRPREEVERYFCCGSEETTPALTDIRPVWPNPWFFWRMLIFGALALIAFYIGFEQFDNLKMIPGLIMTGAFFVPLACLALFFELNILRNISLLKTLECLIGGGCVALVVTLIIGGAPIICDIYQHLGDMFAGPVEETAKIIASILFIKRMPGCKWTLNGLLVGAAVGAGFAGFETAGYIFEHSFGELNAHIFSRKAEFAFAYDILLLRGLFAPFGHIVWTASVVGALCRVKKDAPFKFSMLAQKDFLRVFTFAIMLHMLWNSRLLFTAQGWSAQAFLWTISTFGSWYLVLLLVQDGIKQVKCTQTETAY